MGLHFSDDFSESPFGFTSLTTISSRMSLVNTSGRPVRDVQVVFSAASTPLFQHVLSTPFASQLACLIKFVEFADGNTWRNPAFK